MKNMKNETVFENLFNFLAGYFHEDWTLESSSADEVIKKFIDDQGSDRCHAVARESWVRGQHAYFRTRGYRLKRHADAITAYGLLLAASAPFVIVPIILALTSPTPLNAESALRTILLIASGLLPGIGSIMNEYSERLALAARARQYDRMRMLFERACDRLPERLEQANAALTRAVYLELGQEALRESAEWVSIYRQRPIQPPK